MQIKVHNMHHSLTVEQRLTQTNRLKLLNKYMITQWSPIIKAIFGVPYTSIETAIPGTQNVWNTFSEDSSFVITQYPRNTCFPKYSANHNEADIRTIKFCITSNLPPPPPAGGNNSIWSLWLDQFANFYMQGRKDLWCLPKVKKNTKQATV